MSKIIKMLEAEEATSVKVFDDAVNRLDVVLNELHRDFRDNVISDIPYNFGEHLYTILGENINSTRQVALAKSMFEEGGTLSHISPAEGDTIDDYLQKHHDGYDLHHVYTHYSTGRKFGMSYYNNGKRMYTTYLDKSNVFYYLSQEHVDMIKDEYKRNAAQKFLDLRDEIVDQTSATREIVLDVDITVKGAVVSTVVKNDVLGGDRYSSATSHKYPIIEKYRDENIQHVVITTPAIAKWDGKSRISSRSLRSNAKGRGLEWASLVALGKKGKQSCPFYGNVDISYEDVRYSLRRNNTEMIHRCQQLGQFGHSSSPVNGYRGYTFWGSDFKKVDPVMPKSLVLDWDTIVQDEKVNGAFTGQLQMFKDFSRKLHDLKTEFADLYFLFAD